MRRSFAVGIVVIVFLLSALLYRGRGLHEPHLSKMSESAAPMTQEQPPTTAAEQATAREKSVAIENKIESPIEPGLRYLTVHVITKGAQTPIAGATVLASTSVRTNRPIQTDILGIARIPLPDIDPDWLRLQASCDGFSGWLSLFEKSKGEKIPAEHTMMLDPATLIGGDVVDPGGRPVADAEIRLVRFWGGGESMDRGNQRIDIRTVSTKTDSAGRWAANHIPEEYLKKIQIAVSHPNFARVSAMVNDAMIPELRAQTWLVTLNEGARVSGLITTTNGEPIAGAPVSYGLQYSADRKETKSDADGRYRLKNLALGGMTLDQIVTVLADGFTPASRRLSNTNAAGELNFTLQPGATIRGRVVNVAGEPLKGVRVSRERTSLLNDDGIVWSAQTDGDGRFAWNGAPDSPQKFYFGLAGYAQVRGVQLAPSETEHIITLEKTRTVKGFVRNAATREPVPLFLVLPAAGTIDRMTSWSSSSEREFKNGAFELSLDEKEAAVLRIRARGYITKLFAIPASETEQIEAWLTPAKTMEGVVLDAAGNPIAAADVGALNDGPSPSIMIGKGHFAERQTEADRTVTDENGHFKLDLTTDARFLVAVHPQGGFTRTLAADFESTHVLRLQAWGRLEGRTLVGQTTVGGQEIMLNLSDGLRTDTTSFKTLSDATGKFALDFVPPLEVSIVRLESVGERSWMHRDRTNVVVAPGEVTRVDYYLSKTNSAAPPASR